MCSQIGRLASPRLAKGPGYRQRGHTLFDADRGHLYHEPMQRECMLVGRARQRALALLLLAVIITSGCGADLPPTPTPISLLDPPTVAPSATPSPTATLTPTATATPMPTPTATPIEVSLPVVVVAPSGSSATATPTPAPIPTATPVPLPTPDGTVRTLQVPILMYHYVSEPPAGAGAVRRDLSVTPERFREHLQMLRARGYETISLRQLTLALQTGAPLPARPIILTFDDGYRDNYLHAFRILKEEGMTGTFFAVTRMLDDERSGYLTWGMLVEMHTAGMEIGSHSYEHVNLARQSDAYLIYQVLGSREAIEARTGEPVRFFCYPAGAYDEHTVDILQQAHYWGAVSLDYGVEQRSDELFELRRLRVRGSYDAQRLAMLIDSAYASDASQVDQSYDDGLELP